MARSRRAPSQALALASTCYQMQQFPRKTNLASISRGQRQTSIIPIRPTPSKIKDQAPLVHQRGIPTPTKHDKNPAPMRRDEPKPARVSHGYAIASILLIRIPPHHSLPRRSHHTVPLRPRQTSPRQMSARCRRPDQCNHLRRPPRLPPAR